MAEPAPLLQCIRHKNLKAIDDLELDKVRRTDVDSIEYSENNREALNAAKLIISLKEVKMVEMEAMLPLIESAIAANDPDSALKYMGLVQFKHLITVPLKSCRLAQHPVYQQAFKDAERVDEEDLQHIYEMAWSKISFPGNQLDLTILDNLQDWSFPDYAFAAICNGLLKRRKEIAGLAFPFGLDEDKLIRLCPALQDAKVNEIHLTLRPGVSENTLAALMNTLQSIQARRVTLMGLDPGDEEKAAEFAKNAHIELQLLPSPYQT